MNVLFFKVFLARVLFRATSCRGGRGRCWAALNEGPVLEMPAVHWKMKTAVRTGRDADAEVKCRDREKIKLSHTYTSSPKFSRPPAKPPTRPSSGRTNQNICVGRLRSDPASRSPPRIDGRGEWAVCRGRGGRRIPNALSGHRSGGAEGDDGDCFTCCENTVG